MFRKDDRRVRRLFLSLHIARYSAHLVQVARNVGRHQGEYEENDEKKAIPELLITLSLKYAAE